MATATVSRQQQQQQQQENGGTASAVPPPAAAAALPEARELLERRAISTGRHSYTTEL